MRSAACIAIATDTHGWHTKRLAQAFATLGVETRVVSLAACRVDLDANRYGLVVPGFGDALPDGVLVREIAAGSFEQVTLRLGFLHALAEWGVPISNSPRAVERTVDKSMTSMLLRRAGVPTPATWTLESSAFARGLLLRETSAGHRLVLKPLFGSQGKGLRRLAAGDALPDPAEVAGVFYLQRFVEPAGDDAHDHRLFVVGGRTVAAMTRRGSDWVHNVALGAHCSGSAPDPDLCDLAERAAAAVGADYAGVDLMRDRDGAPLVIEVNGIPAWRGLQSVCALDIAAALAQNFNTCHLASAARAVR